MKKNKLILNKKEIISILGKEYEMLTNIFSDKFGIVNAMLERHELDKYGLFMYQCLSAYTTKSGCQYHSAGATLHKTVDCKLTTVLARESDQITSVWNRSPDTEFKVNPYTK